MAVGGKKEKKKRKKEAIIARHVTDDKLLTRNDCSVLHLGFNLHLTNQYHGFCLSPQSTT